MKRAWILLVDDDDGFEPRWIRYCAPLTLTL